MIFGAEPSTNEQLAAFSMSDFPKCTPASFFTACAVQRRPGLQPYKRSSFFVRPAILVRSLHFVQVRRHSAMPGELQSGVQNG